MSEIKTIVDDTKQHDLIDCYRGKNIYVHVGSGHLIISGVQKIFLTIEEVYTYLRQYQFRSDKE